MKARESEERRGDSGGFYMRSTGVLGCITHYPHRTPQPHTLVPPCWGIGQGIGDISSRHGSRMLGPQKKRGIPSYGDFSKKKGEGLLPWEALSCRGSGSSLELGHLARSATNLARRLAPPWLALHESRVTSHFLVLLYVRVRVRDFCGLSCFRLSSVS